MILKVNFQFIILFVFFSYFKYQAQELLPPISNFDPNVYEAAAQNWSMDTDDKGLLYVANNQGLLHYNGLSWSIHELPDKNVIRSVHVKDSLIYTGAYNEFGYWKKDSTGQLIYHSLTSKTEGFSLNEEIWQILSNKDLIYLRSFGKTYVYDGDIISIVDGLVSNIMISYQNDLYVANRQNGLSVLKKNKLEEFQFQKALGGERIIDFSKTDEKLVIATKSKLFELSNSMLKPLGNNAIWKQLKKWEINKIEIIDAFTLAIGTIKNGIIIYDFFANKIQVLNRANGLQNNTILSLKSHNKKLWIGLDYGIDKVDLSSPVSIYTEPTGELGTVYDVDFINDKIFLGSNTGVYSFDADELKLLQGTEGHTWNLSTQDNTLYINHNSGTFSYSGSRIQKIEIQTGSFILQKVSESSDFLIGTYTGLRHYKDSVNTIPKLNFPIKDFQLQNNTEVWLLGLYDGLFKVEFDSLYTRVKIEKIDIPNGKIDANTRIMSIKNQFTVFNDGDWFKFNPFKQKLENFEELKFLKNKKPLYNDNNLFWFLDIESRAFYITNLEDFHIDLHSKQIKRRLVKNYENIIFKKDSIYIITLKDGYSEVDLSKFDHRDQHINSEIPEVVGLRNENDRFDLNIKDLPYKLSRDLYFDVAYSSSRNSDLKYELNSYKPLKSGSLSSGSIYFQNLYEGDYRLDFFIEDAKKGKVNLSSFEFTISPPWYISAYMRIIYILLSLCIIYLIYKINKIKFKKHKQDLILNYERHKLEETKRQEKEKLIGELNIKSKELANTTLTLAKKNEILLELQKEIKNNQDSFKNKYKLKNMLSKINNALNNKNEWDVFETNFNEIHDEFFKKLLKSYPELTNSDLRLCAYLKMNMTSKEISPLLRISLRGVEVHRYRLRKKLNLNSSQNLNKFLIEHF